MPIAKTTHEFLVRWDDAGKLKGAHIVYREAFTDDAGIEQFSKFGDPLPVLLTDAALLATISGDINTSALADNADKAAQIDALTADKSAAETARDSALQASATAQARITELEAKVKELTAPPMSSTPT